jgi:hypothetical protein
MARQSGQAIPVYRYAPSGSGLAPCPPEFAVQAVRCSGLMRLQEADDYSQAASVFDDSDSDANALKPAGFPQVSRLTLP